MFSCSGANSNDLMWSRQKMKSSSISLQDKGWHAVTACDKRRYLGSDESRPMVQAALDSFEEKK